MPRARSGCDVLVQVYAAAVNPLDRALVKGYGAAILDRLRGSPPFVLGQEFSGVVVEAGSNVMDLRVGDAVYGAVDPWSRCGTLASFIRVHEADVGHKPSTLTHAEAACLPFGAMTVWRPVVKAAQNARASTALVVGRGTIGCAAASLLKHEAGVIVTQVGREGFCGNDGVVFDVVVDASANRGQPLPISHLVAPQGVYVTFNGVWMTRVTQKGAIAGSLDAVSELLEIQTQHWSRNGSRYRWGIMRAGGGRVLSKLAASVDAGSLKPWVDAIRVRALAGGLEELVQQWDLHEESGVKLVAELIK